MPQPILIIGAGVGGLSLAHGLKSHGIPFHIYERDAASSARAQGYRFRIHPAGGESLASVLPASVFSRFEASCAAVPASMARLDAHSGLPPPPPPANGPAAHRPPLPPQAEDPRFNKSYNADRTAFRALLLDEIGAENFSFGKRCVKVQEGVDGVTVGFEDGSEVSGGMVVGADGVGSFVRKWCFSGSKGDAGVDLEPIDTGARCIYGKTLLTPELEAALPSQMRECTTLIQDRTNSAGVMSLFTDPMRFERGDSAQNGASLPPPPADYLYWVLGAQLPLFQNHADTDLLDPKSDLSHGQGSATLSLEMISAWSPAVRAALAGQDVGQTAILRMSTSVPKKLTAFGAASAGSSPATGTGRRVTLLGDAMHVMPPAGGNGANTAIKDAATLLKVLLEEGWSGETGKGENVAEVVRKYETIMTEYAAQAVSGAQKGGAWIFGQPPFEE